MAVERKPAPEPESKEVILRNGQSLRVRPIRPDDKKRLEELFYRLSPRTRYLRFQYAKDHITEQELKYFTEVSPPKRFAYVATIGEAENERIIAVGRWDMLPDGKRAEIAFTVEDNIQLRGLGTILLEELSKAAGMYNITGFEAQVLEENARMLEVFDESGFKLKKHFAEGLYSISIDLKDQEEYAKRQEYREHVARSEGVRRLLYPKRVAVVGASKDPNSVGGALFRNMLKDGFKGVVFPINPSAESIAGVLAYPSVLEVPGEIDVAVIVVPAERVLDVVDQCGQKGVRGLVIISAGFGESGPEGVEREKRLLEKVVSYGMRVIGPNCLGILNNTVDVRLNATFSPIAPPSGNLSIGSQSGALGLALLDHANSINLGIADFVSIGNRIDISTNDLLEFWEDDKNSDVIVLYMESFGNPRKFGRIARRVSHKKPIIAVKAGRSVVGAKAATSHTGALAASDVAADALFRQAGVIRVITIEEMFNAAEVLTHQPLPKGGRVGILTNAGGPGVLAADACEGFGLKVPPLTEDTQNKLKAFLPKAAAVTNPVDMIATAPPESFKKALTIMLDDPGIDSVILIYIPPLVTKPEDIAHSINEALLEYKGEKPVVPCFMMSQATMEGIRRDTNLRPFVFPEDAVQALSFAYNYSNYKTMEEGRILKFPDIDTDVVRTAIFPQPAQVKRGWMMPEAALKLLQDYGINTVDTKVAYSEDEAAEAARRLGFPVAMKVRSAKIVHKTDVGGIAIGLRDAEEVRKAFTEMKLRLESLGRGPEMEGVILQPMVKGGQEMIVGMSIDPLFGPLVMIGLGGTQVELIKDVAFSIHPLRDVDPERMLKQLKSLPLLQGWRGRPKGDIESLKDVLLRFSAIIEDFPEIDQMEINPLIVLSEGQGCAAVDARVYVKSAPTELTI
ncbi:MAG: acetate--CoA ligase family protein [Deltaproteobacteria bacterium]|nr:acetate--CoA ligase family protein [Deltaproteobacteria bacterium]